MIDTIFLFAWAMLSFFLVSDCLLVIKGIKIKEILRNKHVQKQLLSVLKGYIFWYVLWAFSYVGWVAIIWDLRH